jgi:ApbE superfamily uncharacterized protein (UPF0280 family)
MLEIFIYGEVHNMKIIEKEFNLLTGEETITERDATPEEISEMEAARAQAEAERLAAEAEAVAKAAAEAKLEALGLTKEDLQALGL